MSTSDKWGIPLMPAEGVAQSDILFNEAIIRLQVLADKTAVAFMDEPLGAEEDGTIYIVGVGTGLFAGQDNKIAFKYSGQWYFLPDLDPDGADIPMGLDHYGEQRFVQVASPPGFYRWIGDAWVEVGE